MSEKPRMARVVGLALGTLAALVWLSIWGSVSESLFLERVITCMSGLWGYCFFILFVLVMRHKDSNTPVTFLTIGYFFGGLFAPICIFIMLYMKWKIWRKSNR